MVFTHTQGHKQKKSPAMRGKKGLSASEAPNERVSWPKWLTYFNTSWHHNVISILEKSKKAKVCAIRALTIQKCRNLPTVSTVMEELHCLHQ